MRGSVTVNLGVRRTHGQAQIQLNETALRQVIEALEQLRRTVPVGPPSAEALLGIKGVLELVEPEENDAEALARAEAMLASLRVAVQGMVSARTEEGNRLQDVVLDQLTTIERLVAAIERSPARAPDAIRQRLKEQVGRLLETGTTLDEGRLYQEAALLATRADAEEELKRLAAHISAAKELLASQRSGGPAPRFSGAGVQPRSQHSLLQIQRRGYNSSRARSQGRHRPDARAGAEH